MLQHVRATPSEQSAPMPGDGLLPRADVVMDRAFTLGAPPTDVWPWLVQLGKRRAGWYLPRSVERFVPRGRRAIRRLEPRWQRLRVGDVIPDYGGRDETFTVAALEAGSSIVYSSVRGSVNLTWALALEEIDAGTRVRLRLRLHPVRRRWLAASLGELFDALTIAGMASGLAERLAEVRLSD